MYSFIRRFRCRSLSTITWSSRSRRQLPTKRSATPFCQGLRKLVRFGWVPKFFTAIEDQVAGSRVVRECLAQLLNDPGAGRMPRHIEVQNTPPVMSNDEEA